MKRISTERAVLLSELEQIVGKHCHNGSIQNWGPGGELLGEGRTFRYPLTVEDGLGVKRKVYGRANPFEPDDLMRGYYAFGANRLQIVMALDAVLRELEDRYAVEFDRC